MSRTLAERLSLKAVVLTTAFCMLSVACGSPTYPATQPMSLSALRAAAASSSDGELVGRWALAELLAPGGSGDRAAAALKKLSTTKRVGIWAEFAQGIAEEAHGDPRSASKGYVGALTGAATSSEPLAPLVAWFAVRHLLGLRSSVAGLYEKHRAELEALLQRPGAVGWRALAELEDWRALEVYDKAETTGSAYDDEVTQRMGCLHGIRMAGPFGRGVAADVARSFPPDSGAPWPAAWPPDPVRGTVAKVLSVTQKRCMAIADEPVDEGVFYFETFFVTGEARDVLLAVQGATQVWLDGERVLSRGSEEWGSWQRFGAHVLVGTGRHRVVARTLTAAASVRVLNPDGTSANVSSGGDPNSPTTYDLPRALSDPNPINATVSALVRGDVAPCSSPIEAFLAAYAAHADQLDDVASAIAEPLVKPSDAAALFLEMAAAFTAGDPALPDDVRGARARSLRERAIAHDSQLWRARAAAIMDGLDQRGPAQAIDPMRALSNQFPGEPELLEELAQLYGRLGWHAEQAQTLRSLAERFPDDVGALRADLEILEEDGPTSEADIIAARIRLLDPDAEVDLGRALARHDYQAALAELRRLKARRPDRKELVGHIADVLARSGQVSAATQALQEALAKQPLDSQARFRLADRAYAKGDSGALRRALAAALEARANGDTLRAAIDLIEGATDVEPFRRDGRAVIRDYQAWEKAGHHMDGTAARVLDYAAVWVHSDGSSEMLEHEIQKLQSQEAVTAESEVEPPDGVVLHLRVIKPDGREFEPEPVPGKPSLTLPHLEVGDFVELEHVTQLAGDGTHGRRYQSPQWFFREANKGYWRSEFVAVTPADRTLDVETRGNVPSPTVTPLGTFIERSWRVDLSPPAEAEPDSPPITEFLPSVRLGWGISLQSTLPQLVDLATDVTPLDPRLHALAIEIIGSVPASETDERARRLYRWVLEHIQEGKEGDGRHVLTGRSGARQAAFRYLLRLVGIRSELALVKDRLAAPALGGMSEIETYDALVMRTETNRGPRWLTIRDKFAPYGYAPSELRGQPAIVLVEGTPRETVDTTGGVDEVDYEGRADVRLDGSASIELAITFQGSRAIAWRSALEQVPPARLYDFLERELVGPSFDGGHVREMKSEAADVPDQPLVLHLRVEVPEFAKPTASGLSLHPPFSPHLAQLAAAPVRHTPLLRRGAWLTKIRIRVVLPESMKMPSQLPHEERRQGALLVAVQDAVSGHAIDFSRVIDLPPGRVEPGADYATWQSFVQAADALLTRDVAIGK
jgi:tetratricopeptide (TPR) repeat protein